MSLWTTIAVGFAAWIAGNITFALALLPFADRIGRFFDRIDGQSQ